MADTRRALADELLRIGAVQFRPEDPFTWASGIQSPIYTDNRLTLGYPALRRRICSALADAARQGGIGADLIAGTATAGIPHAAWLADRLDLPMVYVRAAPKGHGRGGQIEGPLAPGQTALLIEDLVSTGGSSLGAVAALRAAGADVHDALALFTYGLDVAHRAFEAAGVRLHTLTDLEALADAAVAAGVLTDTQRRETLAWRDRLNEHLHAAR